MNPFYGKKHSPETRAIMRQKKLGSHAWNKGMKMPQEFRDKMSAVMKGRTISQETREKLSRIRKGRKGYWKGRSFSQEHRNSMSKGITLWWAKRKEQSNAYLPQ